MAPEVLRRSYSIEADIWSIGVITYILLSGSRPFWARTESGIFRSVLKSDPPLDVAPWPSISDDAKDFVKRLLTKDRHRRISAAQALSKHSWTSLYSFSFVKRFSRILLFLLFLDVAAHPWLRGDHKIPLDMLIYKLMKAYLRSSALKRAALKVSSYHIVFYIYV